MGGAATIERRSTMLNAAREGTRSREEFMKVTFVSFAVFAIIVN
jgi:hypothetical protein